MVAQTIIGSSFVIGVINMIPDVLVVGAGPVGLFTAIETKLSNPDLDIKIIERNTEYTRHHILRIKEESLKNSEAYRTYDKIRELKGFVPTSQIEGTFLEIAKSLGIEIERGVKVTDPSQLLSDYPDTGSIIGADGAHSIIRRELFNDEKTVDENLQYIIEIKYLAIGKTNSLDRLTYGAALGQVNHLVSENIGKTKEGKTPVSLFVFVDKETYEEIRKKTNQKLSELSPKSDVIYRLLDTIKPWLSLRKQSVQEYMDFGSEKINGVALNVYQTQSFAKKIGNQSIYLVGDAAMGVPYFRALNAGLVAAQVTAKHIAEHPQPGDEQLNALNNSLHDLARGEIQQADANDKKVRVGRKANKVLANSSTLSTGSLLSELEQWAMLRARVKRPNIFRRNPRTTLALIVIPPFAAGLFPVLLPMYSMATAMLLAFASATLVISCLSVVFKIGVVIKNAVYARNHPVVAVPEFPWEAERKEDSSSFIFKSLGSKVQKNNQDDKSPTATQSDDSHFDSPLESSLIQSDDMAEQFEAPGSRN